MIFLVFSNLNDSILFCSMRDVELGSTKGWLGCGAVLDLPALGACCCPASLPTLGHLTAWLVPTEAKGAWLGGLRFQHIFLYRKYQWMPPLEQELCPTACPGSASRPLCRSLTTHPEPTLNLSAWEIRQKMLRLSVKASAVIWSTQMTCTPRQREMKAFRAGEHQQNL